MNLLLLSDGDLVWGGAMARVAGRRAAHLIDVVGVRVGSIVEVGRLGGRLGKGQVLEVGVSSVLLEIALDRDPPPRLDVRLLLALPRPKAMRRILRGCAAIGVRSLFLVNAWRVEKSYWQSPVLHPQALREELSLGLEQGGDTIAPEIRLRRSFKPFVEDELDSLARGTVRLAGVPGARTPCPAARRESVTLAIGPEGGWIPYEVESLRRIGFVPVHLGPRALRVEQAVAALLGRLMPLS